MRKQPHRVWKVRIGNLDDERLCDRMYSCGRRYLLRHKLPERKSYIIEAKGQVARAEKKALKMASCDGVSSPVVLSVEDVQTRHWRASFYYPTAR